MTTVAVMQPYFFPYAGYFRLFAAADLFVIYDCVQFPRRGWVHRNRLTNATGAPGWLTLPLEKRPQETAINEIRLSGDAEARIEAQVPRFPALARGLGHEILTATLARSSGQPLVDILERGLAGACAALGLEFNTVRSSMLRIDPVLAGEQRIIAIIRALGASTYVNAPGGRALYDPAHFAEAGITLHFLDDYQGPAMSILERLGADTCEAIRSELAQSRLAA